MSIQDTYEHVRDESQMLTQQEEEQLARNWRETKCGESRERLITSHMRLVRMIARQYNGRGTGFDELVADGYVGLVNAADRYDPTCGARFSTYATYWIRNAICESFVRNAGGPKLSPSLRADLVKLKHTVEVWLAEHGQAPTHTELATALGWPLEHVSTVQALVAARAKPLLMGALTSGDRVMEIAGETPEASIGEDDALWQRLSGLLNRLPTEERKAIELRFGLDGGPVRRVSSIADMLGTAQRVVRARLESGMCKLSRWAQAESTAAAI